MNEFVTVLNFNLPQEAYVIKARLESEGIICFLKDEFSVQINNFYSNAYGGVKLQVKQSDLKRTVEILRESGYLKSEDFQKSKYWLKFDKATSNIPFLRLLPIEVRAIFALFPIALFLIAIILFFKYSN